MRLIQRLADAAELAPVTEMAPLTRLIPLAYGLAQDLYPELLENDVNAFLKGVDAAPRADRNRLRDHARWRV